MFTLRLSFKTFVNCERFYVYKLRRNNFSTKQNIRVRFAPSPTGFLHLGGLRTALYNYLFAKSQRGVFILRIEDTDQTRLVTGAVEKLQDDLEWAGISPDEGPSSAFGNHGPYKQSERRELYKNEVQNLVKSGHAYHCFCTERRLELLKKEALRLLQIPKYDNKCRHLSPEEVDSKLTKGEQSCVRFKLTSGPQVHDDLVYGRISHDIAAIEGDPVIFKSDGMPTYHLANVVDDHYMEISHVLRGVEWQPSTAKHLLLYKAFGWDPPLYAHIPLLVNSDGSKLSKRHGHVSVDSYRKDGIYPRALVNFVCFTGGFAKIEGDVHEPRTLSIEQLVEIFDLSYVNTNSCRLNFDQLPEFNRAEIVRQTSEVSSLNRLTSDLKQMLLSKSNESSNTSRSEYDLEDSDRMKSILRWSSNRITRLRELTEPSMLFLWTQPSPDQLQHSITPDIKDVLQSVVAEVAALPSFEEDTMKRLLKDFSARHKLNYSKFMKTLRLCLSGLKEGPGVVEIMVILGKESTLKRLKRVISIAKPESSQDQRKGKLGEM